MSPVLLRAAPWPALLGPTVAAALLGAGGLALGGGSGLRVLQLALVLVGCAAACALDDAASAVTRTCPVTWGQQVLARALAAVPAGVVGAVLTGLWWALEAVDRLLLLENGGCWVLGLVLAALARRWLDEPAEVVASGFVLVLVSVMLVEPIASRLQLFPLGEDSARAVRTWWVVLALCLVTLAVVVRERAWRVH